MGHENFILLPLISFVSFERPVYDGLLLYIYIWEVLVAKPAQIALDYT